MSGMIRTSLAALAAVVVYGALTSFSAQPARRRRLAGAVPRQRASACRRPAQADDFAWQRLAELTDTYGNRISGSENLTRAIRWAEATMTKDGLANVRAEKVMVPRWVRGQESAVIVDPPEHPMAMLGLGGSVATPPGGIEADVLVVKDFKDLEARGAQAKGTNRALQRAVHDLRRDRALPRRRRDGGGQARRGGVARAVGRPDGPSHAAHRRHELRRRRRRRSRPRPSPSRTPTASSA